MKTIAITGATGFIGKNLVAELLRLGGFQIKLLSRTKSGYLNELTESGVVIVEGDLLDLQSLNGFLEKDCTVINLVYLWNAGECGNIAAIRNLLKACKTSGVRRLIHCSSAAVSGRVSDNFINESTPCLPMTDYGIIKLKIEKVILEAAKDNFDVSIIRPTAVFGLGGKPLKKLAEDLRTKSWIINYLKSCLFGKRRMNLVNIANVVGAVVFLINRTENLHGETFIISDDDSQNNNFSYVERFLMQALYIPDYIFPRLPVPLNFLTLMLGCLGRNNINPLCNYSSDKILDLGYERACSFETGLADYADWYRSAYMTEHESVVS